MGRLQKGTGYIKTNALADIEIDWILVSIEGKTVGSGSANQPNFTIDVSVYQNGMYTLHIVGAGQEGMVKVIKQ